MPPDTPAPLLGQSDDGHIYESDALEAVAVHAPVDAREYATAFIEAVKRTPEMPTDHETVMSWFAVAVQAGHTRGCPSSRLRGHERMTVEELGYARAVCAECVTHYEAMVEAATKAVLKLNAPRMEGGMGFRHTHFMARRLARAVLTTVLGPRPPRIEERSHA